MDTQPTLATAFERQVRELGLDKKTCADSKELRKWCERNKDHCYIPEWLLKRWGMSVDWNTVPVAPEGITNSLTCEGETINVNLHGALISTPIALRKGMKIEIQV